MEADARRAAGEPVGSTVFVRFGPLPRGGRSKNHLTGKHEDGVSVYEAVQRGAFIHILLPSWTFQACDTLRGCLQDRAFIVRGIVVGTGSDGEVLLKKVKVVREVWREEWIVPRKESDE